MGPMLVVLMAFIVVSAITLVLLLLCKYNRKIQKILKWLKKKIFWNFLLRYFLTSYLMNALNSLTNVYKSDFDNFNSYSALALLVLLA